MKRCTKCGENRPLSEFYRASGAKDGYRGDCKGCFKARAAARYRANPEPVKARARQWLRDNRERNNARMRAYRATEERKRAERASYLRRTYGMTLEQYEDMLAAQGGVCAICGREPNPNISLHVDHDHETGRIRRLLCFSCNNLLGDVSDDATLLEAAADYVRSFDPEIEEATRLAKARVRALIPA